MTVILIIGLIIAMAAAAALFNESRNLRKRVSAAELTAEELSRQAEASRREAAALSQRLADSMAETARAHERADSFRREAAAAERMHAENEKRFTELARHALAGEMAGMKSENEARLLELLVPFREQIKGFQSRVESVYAEEARERFALKSEIARLMGQSESIGREARELASALRGNSKTQGDWGEMILERLLERSGLRRGEEFVVQQTRNTSGQVMRGDDEGGVLRPDVVVYYPGDRAVVIDSKVSLSAFTEWVNAENEQEREAAGRRHVASVRSHIAELRNKRYEEFVSERKLDFVLMFIPNESAYMAAMSLDAGLWQEAYDSRVLIVSPTHLISVLRLVAQLWSHDRQTANALKIAEKAGNLYDKFVGFIEEMGRIERALDNARQSWTTAMNRLRDGRGNLMNRAEELRALGVKTRKSLGIETPSDCSDEIASANPSEEELSISSDTSD